MGEVTWLRDPTGRFPERPYYEEEVLDDRSEAAVARFLRDRHGSVEYPISTDDLTVFLEQNVADLDLYADLSGEGEDVEGVTIFVPNSKPLVRIDRRLSEAPSESRLRTTLTHEFGHVEFHAELWERKSKQMSLFDDSDDAPRCRRSNILGARKADWMEWQAGYACGAILMPISAVRRLLQQFVAETEQQLPVPRSSLQSRTLVALVQRAFQVSAEAARVRLTKLNAVSDGARVTESFKA